MWRPIDRLPPGGRGFLYACGCAHAFYLKFLECRRQGACPRNVLKHPLGDAFVGLGMDTPDVQVRGRFLLLYILDRFLRLVADHSHGGRAPFGAFVKRGKETQIVGVSQNSDPGRGLDAT